MSVTSYSYGEDTYMGNSCFVYREKGRMDRDKLYLCSDDNGGPSVMADVGHQCRLFFYCYDQLFDCDASGER